MKLLGDILEKYKETQMLKQDDYVENDKKIWVFWWTGEESAPEIVKACIKSIRRNANGHEVVMLDRTNYQDYIEFPTSIVENMTKGL